MLYTPRRKRSANVCHESIYNRNRCTTVSYGSYTERNNINIMETSDRTQRLPGNGSIRGKAQIKITFDSQPICRTAHVRTYYIVRTANTFFIRRTIVDNFNDVYGFLPKLDRSDHPPLYGKSNCEERSNRVNTLYLYSYLYTCNVCNECLYNGQHVENMFFLVVLENTFRRFDRNKTENILARFVFFLTIIRCLVNTYTNVHHTYVCTG